jgi:hypothetical protein
MPILGSIGGMVAIGRGSRAGARKIFNITVSANTANYVLNTDKLSGLGYEPGWADVVLTINSGIVVGSSSNGSYAFSVNSTWDTNDTIHIINNGEIYGAGGSGGVLNPGSGGPGLYVGRPTTVTNNGSIGGGGGQGGTNGGFNSGGNGAGASSGGAYGAGGGGTAIYACCPADPNCGTFFTGSGGGLGQNGNMGYGTAGCTGQNYGGGAAGACTGGNSNITWIVTGTRYGALN